jgi:hypothetical protein
MFKSFIYIYCGTSMDESICVNGRTPFTKMHVFSTEKIIITRRKRIEMLSRDCDGCSQRKPCSKRFGIANKGEKVYCPDGTVHLVDASKPTV